MCEGDYHGIMLKCMYVSMIACLYVCSRCLYGDGGCLGGSGHGHSDYSIGLASVMSTRAIRTGTAHTHRPLSLV